MHRYVIADVFTDTPLEGNPVAVFTDAGDLSSELMQWIAREMNLSETVFVLPGDGDADARIRIFTPSTELLFAGHPTLGTALILGEPTDKDMITLATGAGLVAVRFERADGRITAGRMRQPIPTWEPYEHADRLLEALGISASLLPVEAYRNGPRHVFLVLTSEQTVAALEPDMTALGKLPDIGVSCVAGSGTRWKSRMFAPAYGVAEDPATGSAAGPLRCTWRDTAASPSARRSRSTRGPRSAARRRSTPGWRAPATRSTRSRSPAPRWSSPTASCVSDLELESPVEQEL